jgi:hypothetical protein
MEPGAGTADPLTDDDLLFTGADLAQFLAANNWTCQADRSYDQVWLPPADEGDFVRPVLVPRMPTFVDYRKRLAEATESVARLYRWQISQLAEQIAAIHADLFFVRVNQVSRDGTIPLRQATSLLESIDQMIRSAALTAWNPKSSGRGRVPRIVTDFLRDDLRMGHTKKGSFIITVAARLDLDDARRTDEPDAAPADIPDDDVALGSTPAAADIDSGDGNRTDDVPVAEDVAVANDIPEAFDGVPIPSFTRQVMTTLARSLTYVREQTIADEARTTFEVAVEGGLRLPVVQALREIGSAEGLQSVDMSFEWAAAEPVRGDPPTHVTIDREVLDALPTVEARLTQATRPARVTLVGPVSELRRPDEDSDSEEFGEIVVQAEVEGRIRRVTIPLTEADYDWAIRAHRAKLPFTATGQLGKRGNSWRLDEPIEVDRSFLEFRLPRE